MQESTAIRVSEFKEHLAKVQELLAQSEAITQQERDDMNAEMQRMQKELDDMKVDVGRVGMIEGIKNWFGYGVIQKLKNELIVSDTILKRLGGIHDKLLKVAENFSEMKSSVKILCRDFGELIESNKYLTTKIDEMSNEINGLKRDNQDLKRDNQDLKKDNQDLKKDNQDLKKDNQVLQQKVDNIDKNNQEMKSILKTVLKEIKKGRTNDSISIF